MVGAIAITILAPLLWAITTHIDKYLLNKVDESASNIKTLLVFSTLVAGLALSPVWLVICKFSISISMLSLISIFIASFMSVLALYFYLKALETNDASFVTIMFQTIPVFTYFMALILFKEALTLSQIIGSLIIILSAVLISFDIDEKNNKFKFKAMFLMTLSSLCYSIYYICFDIAMRNDSYYSCAFWFQFGLLLMGIVFICSKSYRTLFFKAIKNNGKKYFSLNMLNEVLNLIAFLLVDYANLFIPLAIANISNGFQVIFVFVIGFLGAKFFPKYFEESLSKKAIFQKCLCILLSLLGLVIIFM